MSKWFDPSKADEPLQRGIIRKDRKNSLRVEAVGPDCGTGCVTCECNFKIRVNRKWIEPKGAAFKKVWLQRFNRVYFNSTNRDGQQNIENVPNYNIYFRPSSVNEKAQVNDAYFTEGSTEEHPFVGNP